MPDPSSAKQLFLDALEEPPQQRADFVSRACGGNNGLRTRVMSLLSAHEEDDDDDVLNFTVTLSPAVLDELMQPAKPGRINDYHLIRILGRGGFGVVWLAEQHEPLRRNVALKLLHPALIGFAAHPAAAAEVIARFEAERQALASMDHPNVARVIDAGTVSAGPHANQPYFAMEFVDGPSMTRYCDEHKLDIDSRLRLFIDVCAGVQHAHQKGLIHRDLKPGNVLVATVDGRGTPKVIDFGVSKAIGEISPPTALTQQSAVIGTPQYMSPEQAQLNGAAVDTRSDVYSLGAMLYELLAGSPPIAADTLHGLRVDEICRLVRDVAPPAPSARVLTGERHREIAQRRGIEPARLAARLRGELDWIILKSLSKEPEQRYQSAADLAADLSRHLRHEPILAGPPSKLYRARKFIRRHRAGVAMSIAAAALLIGATVVSLTQAAKARRAEAVAVEQAAQAKKEASKFLAMARFSQGILRSIDPAIARGRDKTLMREVLDGASRRAQNDSNIDNEVAVPILSTIGYAYAAIGETEKAKNHYRTAHSKALQAYGSDHPETLTEAQNYFATLVETGDYKAAEPMVGEIAAAFDRAKLGESADALSFYANCGAMYVKLEKPQLALPYLERAVAGRMKLGPEHRDTFAAQNNLAAAYYQADQLEKAKEIWERLYQLQSKQFGDDHPQTLSTLNNLGMLADKMNDPTLAESRLRQVLATKRRVLQPAHPSRLMTEINLGTFYIDQKKYAEAAAILEPAAADAATLKPEDERRLVLTLRLAEALRGLSRIDESAKLMETVRTAAATLPADHYIQGQIKQFDSVK